MKDTETTDQALAEKPIINRKGTSDVTGQAVPQTVSHTLPLHTRRSHPRIYRRAYIRYARYRTGYFQEAVMCNESGGGMYFETGNRLAPGTKIYIAFDNHPDRKDICANDFFTAEVRWCIPVNHGSDACYGVGVRYTQPIPH